MSNSTCRSLLDPSRPLAVRISWPTLATILLVGTPGVILLAAFRPTSAKTNAQGTESPSVARPEEAPAAAAKTKPDAGPNKVTPVAADKQAATTAGPVLTMRGTAFLPNGSVAKDVVLEQSPGTDSSDVMSATMTEGQFEIRTTGTKIFPANTAAVLIRTPDWNFQALLKMETRTLRSQCAAPKRVTLAPANVIQVKVTDNTQPVADCPVQVDAGGFTSIWASRARMASPN